MNHRKYIEIKLLRFKLFYDPIAFIILLNFFFSSFSFFPSETHHFRSTFYLKQCILPNRCIQLRKNTLHLDSIEIENYQSYFRFNEDWKNKIIQFPLADVTPDQTSIYSILAPCFQLYRERPQFFVLRNAIAHPNDPTSYSIYLEDGSLFDIHKCKYHGIEMDATVNTSFAFRYAIVIPFLWSECWGHNLIDGMGAYLNIPNWVWGLNPVVIVVSERVARDTHNLFEGIGMHDIQIQYSDKYVYAEYMFICQDSLEWCGFGYSTIPTLRKMFETNFNTTNIVPTVYACLNKKPGKGRHFTNFPEIFAQLPKVTGLEWVLIKNVSYPCAKWARQMATIKVLVSSTGSISMNAIFMKDGTGVVHLSSLMIDTPTTSLFYFCNIWTIYVLHKKCRHVKYDCVADVDRVIQNTLRMLYTVEHQKYPENNLFQFYDVPILKKLFYQYGDNFIPAEKLVRKLYKKYQRGRKDTNSFPLFNNFSRSHMNNA